MPPTYDESLIHRIEDLERRLRRTRVIGIVAFLAIILMASVQARPSEQEASLEATEFRLVDQNGNLKGLWTTALGDPQLALMSEGWMVSLTPRLVSQGLAGPNEIDLPFDIRVAGDSLAAGVRFGGPQGQLRFVSTDGAPSVELIDATSATASCSAPTSTACSTPAMSQSPRSIRWR
jgi:hypothetical protein